MYRNSTISTLVSACWRILAKVIAYFDKVKECLLHERMAYIFYRRSTKAKYLFKKGIRKMKGLWEII